MRITRKVLWMQLTHRQKSSGARIVIGGINNKIAYRADVRDMEHIRQGTGTVHLQEKGEKMSRVEEFGDAFKDANKNGGMGRQEWMIFFLTDIALSLARIVDALEAERREDE